MPTINFVVDDIIKIIFETNVYNCLTCDKILLSCVLWIISDPTAYLIVT